MNINKYIAQAGICSRRKADELIKLGKVTINGLKAKPIDKVSEEDCVFVNGREIKPVSEKVYLAFNKPVGVICTNDRNSPNNIIDYIKYPTRIFPVGRLDVNSEGLILLTNDGDFAQFITKSKQVEKEYEVYVDKNIDEAVISGLSNGSIVIDGYPVLPAKITQLSPRSFKIVINEGKNRQIRRMCEAYRLNVTRLVRLRIGDLNLRELEKGKFIEIDPHQVTKLLTTK